MSAQPIGRRRGFLASVAAQLSAFLLEPIEPVVDAEPAELRPYPVVAVVSAAPRSGATTVARALGAELAARADGAAAVSCRRPPARLPTPPTRAAARVAGALRGIADGPARPAGRLCIVAADPAELAAAARYLAPVVLDVPPDGSAAAAATVADRIAVVAPASGEPALLTALARILAGRREPLRVVTRVAERGDWPGRADILLPDSRMAARSALAGARPLGALGRGIEALADALELDA